jgi:hypothetical protein
VKRSVALGTLLLSGATLASASSCSQDPIEVELRSLQRSGAVSFVCLGPPSSSATRPITSCTSETADGLDDFISGTDDQGGELPHLYALITQKTRGELAIVDLTSDVSNVLDQDPATPGPSFLPIGAQPMDIVSTPNGTASFVTTAEVGRPAVFAIPSNRMRPCSVDPARCKAPPPTLTSWPACTLPAAPGDIVIATDPVQETGTRGTCDGGVATPAGTNGDLDAEGRGRQKLIVALPKLGQLVVLDAQQVLDSPPGQLPACTIERTIQLSTEVPAPSGEPPYADGEACVVPDGPVPRPARAFASTPSSLWLSDGRLYVGDLTAPLIHVLEAESACDLVELSPLHATSQEDPNRIVATTKVAASDRLAPDFKRYVYAIDVEDRSLMVFDVTDGTEGKEPLQRPNPEVNPIQPPDRLRFGSAPTDVIVVERDEPKQLPQTGTAPYGQLCNPYDVQDCDATSTSCIPGTRYQTSTDFEEGAGPYTLRGTFAFVALSDGRVAVIDIDDYDAPCRGPKVPSAQYGCEAEEPAAPYATDEASCNVFVPHALRSATYVLDSDLVGRREPGLATFPLLYRDDGTVVDIDDDQAAPRMRALVPETPYPSFEMHVGSEILTINADTGLVTDEEGTRQTLAVNLEDPRSNNADQEWSVTYEGPLPGLEGRAGDLRLSGEEAAFYDAAAAFCDRGVQGEAAQREKLAAADVTGDALEVAARQFADRLTVTQALADQDDPSWEGATCSFQECLGLFGDTTNLRATRDLVVLEAYGDHLDLAPLPLEGPQQEDFECCFPTLVTYEVRPGSQWVAVGAAAGFLHHVVADPDGGACRDSCDPRLVAMTGRVRTAPDGRVLEADPLYAFRNPFFRFAITSAGGALVRNSAFKFTTQGAFSPLVASLIDETTDVLPETINYLPSTGELAIADGSLEGLMLVSTRTMQLNRQFF